MVGPAERLAGAVTARGKKLCLAWLCINLAVIWGNSLLPGHISGQISNWVHAIFRGLILDGGIPGLSGRGLVRKTAHFLEFASLGLVLSLLWGSFSGRKWPALPCGAVVACLDEGIQRFVPGRWGCVSDVLIDCAGVAFGIALCYAGKKIHQQTKNKHFLEETK